MRNSNSTTSSVDESQSGQLVIHTTAFVPMGINLATFKLLDVHVYHYSSFRKTFCNTRLG